MVKYIGSRDRDKVLLGVRNATWDMTVAYSWSKKAMAEKEDGSLDTTQEDVPDTQRLNLPFPICCCTCCFALNSVSLDTKKFPGNFVRLSPIISISIPITSQNTPEMIGMSFP